MMVIIIIIAVILLFFKTDQAGCKDLAAALSAELVS